MDDLLLILEESQGGTERKRMYVTVIVPMPLPKLYTYSVPFHLKSEVEIGVRVEVQLGRQGLYAALVYKISEETPDYKTKPILAILDDEPVVTEKQFKLWEWMADYYVCTMGEVMQAALPAGLKLAGETKLLLHPDFEETDWLSLNAQLNSKESFIIEQLQKYKELSLSDLRKMMNQKTIQPLVKNLLEKRFILLREELQRRYKPKTVSMISLAEPFSLDNALSIKQAFELVGTQAKRQMETLMAYIQLSKQMGEVSRKALQEKADVSATIIKSMEKKGVFDIYEKEVSRLDNYEGEAMGNYELSDSQQKAYDDILESFEEKNVVLLHGVTGSGKTQVFVELMEHVISQGKQVLYLLPEIALTAQIVGRLQRHFGDKIVVYHSKFNNNERVEIWKSVQAGTPIILGARSALFLPFNDLGLILVDEEHDPSYKQTDPSPRYNARDTAVFLSYLYNAKTLLGTATPSIESYKNVQQGKYALVEMKQRFGGLALPKIELVDLGEENRLKRMKSLFSSQLLDALQETLDNGEQAILFQNRRGYAPVYHCGICGWTADCNDCDVSLTYHKYSNDLHCHYCGYQTKLPKTCKACGSTQLIIKGFGTEKIEDELQIYLPDVKVMRMDWDTVKGKEGHDRIIKKFERKEVNVLVGTQMVTKGLDFDNVGLVGVLSADQMLHFPDFRASERAFQLITQVAGRAGRKKKQGRVVIQAFNIGHPVLKEVMENDFDAFIKREMRERYDFLYPPYYRLIQIQLKHKKSDILAKAAQFFADRLRSKLGERVLGPAVPGVARVRTYYLMDIMIKLGLNSKGLNYTKELIREVQEELKSKKKIGYVRVLVNVDPY
jgi:primosomal protein N' (replication factor Y)